MIYYNNSNLILGLGDTHRNAIHTPPVLVPLIVGSR